MDHQKDIHAPDSDLTIWEFMSGSHPHGVAQANVLPGDYHIHTTFSDGTGSVAACIEQAISVGLTEIGIADHLSAVQPSVWEIPSIPLANLECYVAEVREAASRYPEITVLLGVEADYVPEHESQLRALLDAWPFDYVIGGVHGVDGFDFDDPGRRHDPRWSDADSLFVAYYETVRRAARFGGFDIIAHLDYIGLWGHTPGPGVSDSIDAALDAIAASGAAIELNTDRFSDPAGVMYPSDDLLRALGDRGSPLVISSDAHAAQHVGRLWGEAMERAARAGFWGALRLSDRTLVPLPQRAVAGGHREPPFPTARPRSHRPWMAPRPVGWRSCQP
jgi:histidinol-phosphatase (PHP family)